ncbi:MAG: DUF4783 domain-containing protein [Bacteroidetes bacterium]|nr:DUF4783 domain-containing protein [Bacteroidota bacterium]MBS1975847.1 DUF4783 domain-containing protein [Bacteroidota bacterium]
MIAMRHLLVLWTFLLGLSLTAYAQTEIFAPMKEAIKAGDASQLTRTFAQAVDINLEGNISTYSKAQSEFVLKEFFKKHPVSDFSIVHTGSSKGGLQFAIGRYLSGKESYNVLMRVRQVGTDYLVHEISFVKE